MGNAGAKIKEGFQWLGGKLGEGWNHVKAFGKKAWDAVKSVPVLGSIASGIEKYTPIGWAATSALKTADALATGGSKLLQGDIKGAVGTATAYGRDALNYTNPLLDAAKKIPVLGTVASGVESALKNIPVYGGMSINTIRSIGNAGLNATDAFKDGDVKGGLINLAKGGAGYLSSRGGKIGAVGTIVDKIL